MWTLQGLFCEHQTSPAPSTASSSLAAVLQAPAEGRNAVPCAPGHACVPEFPAPHRTVRGLMLSSATLPHLWAVVSDEVAAVHVAKYSQRVQDGCEPHPTELARWARKAALRCCQPVPLLSQPRKCQVDPSQVWMHDRPIHAATTAAAAGE